MKKGQITLYVVIGSFLLIGLIFLFYHTSQAKSAVETEDLIPPKETAELEQRARTITEKLSACMEISLEENLADLAINGLYDEPPEGSHVIFHAEDAESLQLYVENVPSYIIDGKPQMPSLEKVMKQLGPRTFASFEECAEPYYALAPDSFYDFEPELTLTDGNVIFEQKKTILLKEGDQEKRITLPPYTSDVNLTREYNIIKGYLEEQAKNMSGVKLNTLMELADTEGFTYELDYYENGIYLYHFIFPHQREDIVYAFVIQYDWEADNEA